jgi:glycogen debranching enzyme
MEGMRIDDVLSPDGWAYASVPGRYHALFGRDSLIFALQVLPVRPDVAAATLRAHARLQGRVEDPKTEEQPGRIVHEYRPVAPQHLIDDGWPVRDGGIRYYGTSDATSWFLVLLDATADPNLQRELAPAREAAAGWLGRAVADGFVRCGPRRHPGGLSQQGWRDSREPAGDPDGGGIVHPDGSTPVPPLADADSQAAAIAALRALTRLDVARREHWAARAAELTARVRAAFTPGVLAVDGTGRPVTGAGSQLGWLLWAGAIDDAERLTRPDILTPYGVRTLAASEPAFRVDGYHRGAVWPFDNWFAWGGLRAAGRHDDAERVRAGVRRALTELGGYPELYAVTRAGELRGMPISTGVQAWTLGAAVAFDADWTGHRT